VINRRLTGNNFHIYLKPDRLIDPEAFGVHGIADEFLLDKPEFGDIADDFIEYIRGAELVIHNASFDIGFLDYEFSKLNRDIPKTNSFCKVTDSLALARKMFPGKRNSLDALCSRYDIDNSKRTLHGALLDSQILADVYLLMTGGQTLMSFSMEGEGQQQGDVGGIQRVVRQASKLKVVLASDEELVNHESRLDLVQKKGGSCLWRA
jgi:DNA polymerase-3 subunit epsilon